MFNWLHHLFNPHCEQCRIDNACETCDTLRDLLEKERAEKFRLLGMLHPTMQPVEAEVDMSKLRRHPKAIMRELEMQSRREAAIIRNRATEDKIESLEQELMAGTTNANQ